MGHYFNKRLGLAIGFGYAGMYTCEPNKQMVCSHTNAYSKSPAKIVRYELNLEEGTCSNLGTLA